MDTPVTDQPVDDTRLHQGDIPPGTIKSRHLEEGILPTANSQARAYLAGSQVNLTNSTWTLIALDTKTYDVGTNFSTSTHKYTVPITGYYYINGLVQFTNIIASKTYGVSIGKNGTVGGAGTQIAAAIVASGTDVSQGVTAYVNTLAYLTRNDTIELDAIAYAGVSTVDITSGTQYTYLEVIAISK